MRTASALSGSLINTLFGAKDGGHIIEAHIDVDEFASHDATLRLSYDNNMVLRVNRPSTRL